MPTGPRSAAVNQGNGAPGWRIPGAKSGGSPVRWGLGDFLLAWVFGIIGATIAVVPFATENGKIPVAGLVASLLGQSAATLAFLEFIAAARAGAAWPTTSGS